MHTCTQHNKLTLRRGGYGKKKTLKRGGLIGFERGHYKNNILKETDVIALDKRP